MTAELSRRHPARGTTKQEAVLALLRQPTGATIVSMMTATGWQAHSVRGILTGVVRRKLKLKLESAKENGESYQDCVVADAVRIEPVSTRKFH